MSGTSSCDLGVQFLGILLYVLIELENLEEWRDNETQAGQKGRGHVLWRHMIGKPVQE